MPRHFPTLRRWRPRLPLPRPAPPIVGAKPSSRLRMIGCDGLPSVQPARPEQGARRVEVGVRGIELTPHGRLVRRLTGAFSGSSWSPGMTRRGNAADQHLIGTRPCVSWNSLGIVRDANPSAAQTPSACSGPASIATRRRWTRGKIAAHFSDHRLASIRTLPHRDRRIEWCRSRRPSDTLAFWRHAP